MCLVKIYWLDLEWELGKELSDEIWEMRLVRVDVHFVKASPGELPHDYLVH